MINDQFEYAQNHDKSIHYLIKAYQCNRLHHALLFTGIEGVGRFHVALQFAMMCNCENISDINQNIKPCRDCRSCRRIISNQHPDMIQLYPDGAALKIDQIRAVRKKLAYKPVIAKTRFVFIIKANVMTAESANALLKILEEPPANTIFILIVENQKDVLQTISSRCQQIRFRPCAEKQILNHLLNKEGLVPENAQIIAGLSMGSFIRAERYQKKKWIYKRTYILNSLSQLDQLSIGMRLGFAEQLSKNKDDIPIVLEIFLTWFRDVLIYKFCPERIINIDFYHQIYDQTMKNLCDSIIHKIEQIQIVQKDLMANTNKRLAFEQLMLIHL